jgi:hypothetical protein
MRIPSRILAGVALAGLVIAGPDISSAWGAYDNGLLTLLAPVISLGIVVIGPVLVIATIVVMLAIWMLALASNLGVLVMGDSSGFVKKAAIGTLYVFSALIFVGVLLAITNFGQAFVKGSDAGREPLWHLALPIVFALIARLY